MIQKTSDSSSKAIEAARKEIAEKITYAFASYIRNFSLSMNSVEVNAMPDPIWKFSVSFMFCTDNKTYAFSDTANEGDAKYITEWIWLAILNIAGSAAAAAPSDRNKAAAYEEIGNIGEAMGFVTPDHRQR